MARDRHYYEQEQYLTSIVWRVYYGGVRVKDAIIKVTKIKRSLEFDLSLLSISKVRSNLKLSNDCLKYLRDLQRRGY